jgi:Uri superfamily endonuclease
MDKGIYCVVFENPACTVRVGALGDLAFEPGWHIYVGSALGSGGLTRLERHIGLARTRHRPPKWHVDYLLTEPRFFLTSVVSAKTTDRLECSLAGRLGGASVPGFGCSDCGCRSHLMHRDKEPVGEIAGAFRHLGLSPAIKRLMRLETKANV